MHLESAPPVVSAGEDLPPATATAASNAAAEPIDGLRIGALILLILLTHAWIMAQTDLDGSILALIDGGAAIASVVFHFARKRTLVHLKRFGRSAVRWLTRDEMLITAYAVFLIFGSIFSSVTVFSSGAGDVGSVTLGTEGSSDLSSEKLTAGETEVRFYRFTNPFGRPLYLDVHGYQRHSFDLYPWIPSRIRVAKDLQLSPSLLIRVPDELFTFVVGGRIELSDGVNVIAEGPVAAESASILVGEQRHIPDSFTEAFKRELTAARENEEMTAKRLDSWLAPVPAKSSVSISSGMHLRARFLGPGELAARDFVVGDDVVQDIRLRAAQK